MHWYDWHTVTERLQGRSYALTRGRPYKVILDPDTSTGTCDFTNKRILINPNLFDDVFQDRGLTGAALDKANFLVSRAITGHEALHVVYSDPEVTERSSKSSDLKMVFNLLEDARVEKIGSESSHVSKTLFKFVNTIAGSQLPAFTDTDLSDSYSGLSLLLRWRLRAAIPQLTEQGSKIWNDVRVLADDALYAVNSDDALGLARKIVRILGLRKAKRRDSDALKDTEDVMRRMQSDVSGSNTSQPLPNPVERDEEDRSPEETQAENSSSSEPDDGEERVATDDAPTDSENPNDTDAEADRDETQHSATDADDDDSDSPQSPPAVDPVETQQDDIEKLVEDTARSVSEDLNSMVPGDPASCVARARSYYGTEYPDIQASPYVHYMPAAVPIASDIIRELKAESPRAVSGASEYAGRFNTRYFVRDYAKPFSATRFHGISTPQMALSLVIDRSGSMEGVVEELRIMSMAITMASETLSIPLSIWALEGRVHIKRFDEHGPQVPAKIAGINAETLTTTMPTICDAVKELRSRPETLKQIVFIHDGMPGDKLDFIDWRNDLRGIGLFCMFIMPEADYKWHKENPETLRESMDELVGPRNYAIAPVSDIAKHWCSFVRNRRNRHSSPIR